MAIGFSGSASALFRPRRMVYVAVDTWAATESLIQGLERRLLGELPGLYSRHGGVLIGFLWILALVMENIGFLLIKYVSTQGFWPVASCSYISKMFNVLLLDTRWDDKNLSRDVWYSSDILTNPHTTGLWYIRCSGRSRWYFVFTNQHSGM